MPLRGGEPAVPDGGAGRRIRGSRYGMAGLSIDRTGSGFLIAAIRCGCN
jgi:hypothetical protein